MVLAANFFKLDSLEPDSDEERTTTTSKVAMESQGTLAEHNSLKKKKKKKASVGKSDSDDGGKKSKKKHEKVSGGDEIGNTESSKVNEANLSHEKALVNTDDDDDAKRKRKRVDDTDLEDTIHKPKNKKKKKTSVDSDNSFTSANSSEKKSKENIKREDPEAEVNNDDDNQIETENPEKSTKDPKKKRKKQIDDPEVEEDNRDSTKDPKKRRKKKQSGHPDNTEDAVKTQTEAEENDLNSPEDGKKKRNKKKKNNPEAEENTIGKEKRKKQIDDPEVEEDNKDSTQDPKKKRKKKQSGDPDNTEDAEKTQTEVEENNLSSPENGKKKRNKKKKKNPEAEENNNGKEKRKKKKQKGSKSDDVVTTPPSKSAKKVNFSDHVEVFPAESEESDNEEEDEEVDLVRGKRFTKEEDELIKKSVLEYIDNHALGDEGLNMVMNCKAHKQIKGCWKEIGAALPWRPYTGVYYRAHILFEEGSKGVWSKEDLELVVEYQKKHGNDWKTLADAMGKHRVHVKDAWRRIRLASKNKGHWTMEEYQNLFDLVNKDLRMKAFREKHSKHGMLRDNIPWMAISDQLGTRDHTICCMKWYDQLTSPMVAKGIWANVDDYMLLDELTNLDAACVDDVDWDNLLDNRDGDACRSRWNQMVRHIGIPGTKTFAEQVEILSQRYCPDIAEDREDFDNRPFDPED